MYIGVFGPRFYKHDEYDNFEYIQTVLDVFLSHWPAVTQIHSGGGKGVESMASKYAAIKDIEIVITPPNIVRDGHERAFEIRNREIADKINHAVLFWDSWDDKYVDLIKHCARNRTPVTIYGLE